MGVLSSEDSKRGRLFFEIEVEVVVRGDGRRIFKLGRSDGAACPTGWVPAMLVSSDMVRGSDTELIDEAGGEMVDAPAGS